MRRVAYWTEKALTFKHQIIEKYMRLVMLEAHAYATHHKQNNPHIRIDLDEVAQNFILAVSKAIDKCNANKGTLTSYVQMWLKDARNTVHFQHSYGFAYSIPTNKRREIAAGKSHINNMVFDLDSAEAQSVAVEYDLESDIDNKKIVNTVRAISKQADPTGLGRLTLQITEVLSPKERQLLKTAC